MTAHKYITSKLKVGFTLTSLAGQAKSKLKAGFTLIELLIVMAILGVLAVVVLVAINPAEQMRRARDTGRISGSQQIGRALAAYLTANGTLPADTSAAAWTQPLLDSEELQTIPAGITATGYTACTAAVANGTWCYDADVTSGDFVLFAALESQQRITSCGASATTAYAVYSSRSARGGVVEAAPTATGTITTWCGQ